jgi:hypothetical protein
VLTICIFLFPFIKWINRIFHGIKKIVLPNVFSISVLLGGFPAHIFHPFYGSFILLYDYSVFFVFGIFLLYSSSIKGIRQVIFVFFASLFFENLGLVFALYFIIKNKKILTWNNLRIFIVSGLGPIFTVLTSFIFSQQPINYTSGSLYFSYNVKHVHLIAGAFFLLNIYIFSLAYIHNLIFRKLEFKIEKSETQTILTLLVILNFTYVIGFFNSGLAFEGARQTLIAQVLFLIYCKDLLQKKVI